jgi:hypothetical protein
VGRAGGGQAPQGWKMELLRADSVSKDLEERSAKVAPATARLLREGCARALLRGCRLPNQCVL